MKSIAEVLAKIKGDDSGKYLKHEWQQFAYNLANWLDDTERISMYMKLAKEEDRMLLQKAWDFVKESNARSKPKLFLWKVAQLRKEREEKEQ
jgi:hypothetical protein